MRFELIILILILLAVLGALYLIVKKLPQPKEEDKESEELANLKKLIDQEIKKKSK